MIVLALRARSCIALEPANPPVPQANPLVTSIHLFYFSTGLWENTKKHLVRVEGKLHVIAYSVHPYTLPYCIVEDSTVRYILIQHYTSFYCTTHNYTGLYTPKQHYTAIHTPIQRYTPL